jgi:hypothetical protein
MLKTASRLRQQGHSKYFNNPFVIMNRAHEEMIEKGGKIPEKTFVLWGIQLLVALMSSFLLRISVDPILGNSLGLWVDWIKNTSWIPFACEIVLGFILGRYIQSFLNVRHQIGLFQFLIKHPETLNGSLTFSPELLFTSVRSDLKISAISWSIIFLFTLQGFFLGGIIFLVWTHFLTFKWERSRLSG